MESPRLLKKYECHVSTLRKPSSPPGCKLFDRLRVRCRAAIAIHGFRSLALTLVARPSYCLRTCPCPARVATRVPVLRMPGLFLQQGPSLERSCSLRLSRRVSSWLQRCLPQRRAKVEHCRRTLWAKTRTNTSSVTRDAYEERLNCLFKRHVGDPIQLLINQAGILFYLALPIV